MEAPPSGEKVLSDSSCVIRDDANPRKPAFVR